jgi:hypothetical protein
MDNENPVMQHRATKLEAILCACRLSCDDVWHDSVGKYTFNDRTSAGFECA